MSIASKLEYLQETKNQIKNAITGKGVPVSDTDTFRSYADKITSISAGTGTSSDDWQPEPDWWDIEAILANDTEDYSQKIICLLTDELDDGVTKLTINGANKYKLSDGQVVSGAGGNKNISNIFDKTKDKECSKGYKTRYIIYYKNSDYGSMLTLPNNAIYVIFSGVKFSNTPFQDKRFLQAVKFINNTKYLNEANSMFDSCYNLREVPSFDTTNVTNMNNMFGNCYNLREVPSFDTTNVTSMNNMFGNCYNLREVPSFDTTNVTSMSNMFNNCYNLREVPSFDTTNVTNMSSMFYNCCSLEKADLNITIKTTITNNIFNFCRSLKKIPSLDLGNNINPSNMFNNCSLLTDIQNISNIKANISFSLCTYLNHSTLLRILNALVDLTDQTTQTLTLGSTNLAKLTDEEKAIATNKNWTLA